MIRKFATLTLMLALSAAVLAQTPAAPSATPQQQQRPAAPAGPPPTKVGVINIEQAILMTNEGQRDFGNLQKQFEPKRTELENLNKELETLRNELSTQGEKLNEAARGEKTRQIEQKQKAFQRSYEDAQQEFQAQQTEIANRIGEKLVGLLNDYAQKNGYAVIIDLSAPQQRVWANPAVDVTREIVTAYNTQSGIPAPARPATTGATTGQRPGQQPPARPAQQPPARPGQPR